MGEHRLGVQPTGRLSLGNSLCHPWQLPCSVPLQLPRDKFLLKTPRRGVHTTNTLPQAAGHHKPRGHVPRGLMGTSCLLSPGLILPAPRRELVMQANQLPEH